MFKIIKSECVDVTTATSWNWDEYDFLYRALMNSKERGPNNLLVGKF